MRNLLSKRHALLFILLFWTLITKAQELHTCATSRLSSSTRSAVVSPAHQQLMNRYDMSFYKLDLQLERNSTYIAGNVTLAAKVKSQPLSAFAFELHPNFTMDSVIINGSREMTIVREGAEAKVMLANPIPATGKAQATIFYKGTAPNNNTAAIGNGFSTAIEPQWKNQVTWSLSEPYAAYEWWPTKQTLTDKADSVHVFVTTSAENKVGSNGLLTKVVDLPGSKKRFEWKSRYPIDYYLVSVAISTYDEYLQEASIPGISTPVPILNYVYKGGALSTFKNEMDRTPGFLEYFSQAFGLYPFHKEKYGHSMAPMGGGMEHQTMTTQSTFTFTLTAHELAHQWFGDNVTCASWQDIWLNEGFASYSEYLALQQFEPSSAELWIRNAHNLALQRPNGSVKVLDTLDVRRIFDFRLSYKKGASVVHMLRFELNNDQVFFDILKTYQQRFGGGTAKTIDLQKVTEEVSGKNFDYFFNQWYSGEGYPLFSVQWNQDGDNLLLATKQSGSGNTPFFRTDMEYKLTTLSGDTTIRVTHTKPEQNFLIKVEGNVTAVEVDPNNWVLKQVIFSERNPDLEVPDLNAPYLYPNPVAGTSIKVENTKFIPTEAQIFNMAGKAVRHQKISPQSELEINVVGLPAGAYQLLLSNGEQEFKSGFIKLN